MKNNIKGVLTAMITPFKNDTTAVDIGALKNYLNFLIDKGINGVFVAGTTGEGLLLSVEERIKVFSEVAKVVKDRISVIAHVGDISTNNAIELAKGARDCGITAVSAMLPYFYPLDEPAIFIHFQKIAASVPGTDFYVYNIPGGTVNNLSLDLFKRLTNEIDNFVGAKTSSADFFLLKEYIYASGDKFDIFVGSDALDFAGLMSGAKGLISGNSSAFPEPFVILYKAIMEGDVARAREMQKCIDELRGITHDGRYLAMFKIGLGMRGVSVGPVRGSLRDLTSKEDQKFRDLIKDWSQRWQMEL